MEAVLSDSLETRAAELLALVDPLRRAAAREKQVAHTAWGGESLARVSDALGCSLDDLRRLDGRLRRVRPDDDSTPSEQLRLSDLWTMEVELPLGDLDSNRAQDWLVITRSRSPAAPNHEWRLERHRVPTAKDRPGLYSAMWGWYWPNLTAEAIAMACDPDRVDPHYLVGPDGRLRWMQAGVSNKTAPSDTAAVLTEVQTLVRITKQDASAYKLQVRLEDWKRPSGDEVQRWGYRVLDPSGAIVSAVSSAFSWPSEYERGYDTRAGAIEAGRAALKSAVHGSGWREGNWENIS